MKKNKTKSISKHIAIIGAGTAGIATAISAARKGITVKLIEHNKNIGGAIIRCLINTLGGIYNINGDYLNPDSCHEFTKRAFMECQTTKKEKINNLWILKLDPNVYKKIINKWIQEEPNIEVFKNARISNIEVENNLINEITISQKHDLIKIHIDELIDATGNASIVHQINKDMVIKNDHPQLAGLIYHIAGIDEKKIEFPGNIQLIHALQSAARNKDLPQECLFISIDKGFQKNSIYIKISLPMSLGIMDDYFHTLKYHNIDLVREKLLLFLKKQLGFFGATVVTEGEIGIRSARCMRGEYCLTETDIVKGNKFYDALCCGSWPIEFWAPSKGLLLKHLENDTHYEIPIRTTRAQNYNNLWSIGKCISADNFAQSSLRIWGNCWAMGYSLGKHLARF